MDETQTETVPPHCSRHSLPMRLTIAGNANGNLLVSGGWYCEQCELESVAERTKMADLSKYRQIDFDFVEPTDVVQAGRDLNRLKLAMKHMEEELHAAREERTNRDPAFVKWRQTKVNEFNAIKRRYNALKQWQRDHCIVHDDGRRDVRTDLTRVLTGDLVYELKLRVEALEELALQAIGYRDAYVGLLDGGEDDVMRAGMNRCLEALRRAVAIYEGLETLDEPRREAVI